MASAVWLAAFSALHAAERVSGHAHNDYLHERPLLDALDAGFSSLEVDVFLVGDQLLVGHTRLELRSDRTLERLYLEPLLQIVGRNEVKSGKKSGGYVFAPNQELQLLVDIKTSAEPTYERLAEVLENYRAMLTRVENSVVHRGAVTVVLSGNRPIESVTAQPRRLVALDGRLSDLEIDGKSHASRPPHLMPLISDRWGAHFRWNGTGEMSTEESKKLADIVNQTHAAGRKLRFWATPDEPSVWARLRDAGVDYINADDLVGLKDFLEAGK